MGDSKCMFCLKEDDPINLCAAGTLHQCIEKVILPGASSWGWALIGGGDINQFGMHVGIAQSTLMTLRKFVGALQQSVLLVNVHNFLCDVSYSAIVKEIVCMIFLIFLLLHTPYNLTLPLLLRGQPTFYDLQFF